MSDAPEKGAAPPHPDRIGETVYGELRRVAARYLQRERSDHTLDPTALVHETWLRLSAQRSAEWVNRDQFVAFASTCMRRILVDHARARARHRRGSGAPRVAIDDVEIATPERDVDLLALEDALDDLAALDPRACTVVEYRFFGGFTSEETARALGISTATVEREWRLARGWLATRMRAIAP